MPLRTKLVFAALTLVLFFVLLEFSLALIGIQPAYRSGDPLVGFSKQLPYFIEGRDPAGGAIMTTAPGKEALNSQSFPREKPAGTFRIVCLGGSTTYGRPFWDETSFSGWLRAYLPAADSARTWEVINAGGISYASYRVLAVAEELAKYTPDLFVLYVGHNEFLEQRTYGDLLDQPELLKDMRASAYRLRTATLIQRIAKGFSRSGREKPIVLDEEVKRIPINAVGPEAYTRDDTLKDQVVTHFRLSLNRILDVAEQGGAKVILVSPASNYRAVTPFKSEQSAGLAPSALDAWRVSYAEAMNSLKDGDDPLTLARLDECLAIDSRHAATHYHRGRTLMNLSRYEEARAAFAQAIEEDICPLRAIRATLDTIRETATARNVPLVDFQGILDARAENGIAGEDFFFDHLHPNIEAHRLLALDILERMTERAWISPQWSPPDREAVERKLRDGIDRDRYGKELAKLSYAMDAFGQEQMALASVREALELAPDNQEVLDYGVSFYAKRKQFETVAKLLEAKVVKTPGDQRALTALGDAYSKMQNFAAAAETYQRLRTLDPSSVTVLQQLGIARSHAGDHELAASALQEAARLNSQSAHIQNNLGLVLATGGKHHLATQHYEMAVDLMPSLSSAHYNWGLSLAALHRKEEAAEKFTRVLELQPGHPGATAHLRVLE